MQRNYDREQEKQIEAMKNPAENAYRLLRRCDVKHDKQVSVDKPRQERTRIAADCRKKRSCLALNLMIKTVKTSD